MNNEEPPKDEKPAVAPITDRKEGQTVYISGIGWFQRKTREQ